MPTTSDSRYRIERFALFFLGVIAIVTGAAFSAGLWPLGLSLFLAAIAAGVVEAASVRRTGRRQRIWSWLPTVLGMVAVTAVTIALEQKGPDSGLALSIVVAAFVVAIPLFALVVNLVAIALLRLRKQPIPERSV